jgi:hypothetical protein
MSTADDRLAATLEPNLAATKSAGGRRAQRAARALAPIAALALICLSVAACGAGGVPGELGHWGRRAGNSSMDTLLRVLTPGLGIPCAGRRGERGFSETQAKACLARLAADYARGVRDGVGAH